MRRQDSQARVTASCCQSLGWPPTPSPRKWWMVSTPGLPSGARSYGQAVQVGGSDQYYFIPDSLLDNGSWSCFLAYSLPSTPLGPLSSKHSLSALKHFCHPGISSFVTSFWFLAVFNFVLMSPALWACLSVHLSVSLLFLCPSSQSHLLLNYEKCQMSTKWETYKCSWAQHRNLTSSATIIQLPSLPLLLPSSHLSWMLKKSTGFPGKPVNVKYHHSACLCEPYQSQ